MAAKGTEAETPNMTLRVLRQPGEGQPTLDVLFFHGLQLGSYKNAWEDTWKNKDKVVWPSQWLGAKDFPTARIMSISYDSQAFGGKKTMDQISNTLLHEVCVLVSGSTSACARAVYTCVFIITVACSVSVQRAICTADIQLPYIAHASCHAAPKQTPPGQVVSGHL
jgi:hypothetical protein